MEEGSLCQSFAKEIEENNQWLLQVITGNVNCVFQSDLETKQQSMH
jgi:hypothetical protein